MITGKCVRLQEQIFDEAEESYRYVVQGFQGHL